MNYSGFIKAAFSVAVVMLVVVAVVLPIFADAAPKTETTIENTGVPFASADEQTHEIVISATQANAGPTITTDGAEVDLSSLPDGVLPITEVDSIKKLMLLVYSDQGAIYVTPTATSAVKIDGDSYAYDNVSRGSPVTITIDGDTATMGAFTLTGVKYYISSSGDYVFTDSAAVLSDTKLCGGGGLIDYTVKYTFDGTITDSDYVVKFVYTSSGTATMAATGVSYNPVLSDDGNYYNVSAPVFNTTLNINGTESTADVAPGVFIAPASITYEVAEDLGVISVLINILPVLMIVGVLVATVHMFASNRRA